MKRVCALAFLSILSATHVSAAQINLNTAADLAAVFVIANDGDEIFMNDGTSANAGAVQPIDMGITINGTHLSSPITKGILNFTNSNAGLTFSGVHSSVISNIVLSGKASDRNILSEQNLTLNNVDMIGTNGIESTGDLIINGGRFINNSTNLSGGAVWINNAVAEINGAVWFEGNTATTYGGAIYISVTSSAELESGITFDSNHGYEGGAIANFGKLNIDDNATFTGNIAETQGGAIYNNTGVLTIGNDAVFKNNVAIMVSSINGNGGAIFNASTSTLEILDAPQFLNNSAGNNGGGIYSSGNLTIGDNAVFDGNNANNVGGAIFNLSGTINIGDNATFIRNTSEGNGGALYSNGINIGNGAKFTDNISNGGGGAIYAVTGTVEIGGNTVFQGNKSTFGGAIMAVSLGIVKLSDTAIGDITFDSNSVSNQTQGGGAIAAMMGTVDFSNVKGNIKFVDNSTMNNGGAIYNGFSSTINIGTTDGYKITFENNTASKDGGAIYNNASINITGDVDFTNNSSLGNGGAISLMSSNNTNISGKGTFSGNTAAVNGGAIYSQSSELTLNTTLGDMIFENNTASNRPNDIHMLSGTVNIKGAKDTKLSISGGISGSGTINKTGENEFLIKALTDNSLFNGTFSQTDGKDTDGNIVGKTVVETARSMFNGGISKNFVSESILEVTGSVYSYGVTLGNEGILNHHDRLTNVSIIDNTNLRFSGANAKAIFDNLTSKTENANYILGDNIINADGTSINYITFNDANVLLAQNDYTGNTKYNFEDSNISLSGPALSDMNQMLREVVFDNNFTASNSILSFDISGNPNISAEEFASDRLIIKNSPGSIVLGLGAIRVLDDKDNGLTNFTITDILDGASFDPAATAKIATIAYVYDVSVDVSGNLLFNVSDGAQSGLYSMTTLVADEISPDETAAVNRGFNFSFYNPENALDSLHYISRDFDNNSDNRAMTAGNFYVQGYDNEASHSVISGLIKGGIANGEAEDKYGSLFNVQNATNFLLKDLTVQDFYKDDGAIIDSGVGALKISNEDAVAIVNNVIFKNNKTSSDSGIVDDHTGGVGGAAIWIDEGALSVANSRFEGNDSERGGAIYIIGNSETHITNTMFIGNTAREKHGGAIEILDAESIIIENSKFHNNTAARWGGAIALNDGGYLGNNYIDGVNFDGYNEFIGNKAAYGGAIYSNMVSDSRLHFNGDVLFKDNIAEDDGQGTAIGGAIAISQNHGGVSMDFNGNAQFIGNKALSKDGASRGGAMYIVSVDEPVNIIFNGSALFKDNYTDGEGGAIGFGDGIADKSNLTFNMNEDTVVLFENNSTAKGANDIYFDGDTVNMNINGSGGVITLNGGIASANNTDNINMNSTGTMNFGQSSVNNNFSGTFTANAGTTNIYSSNWISGDNYIKNGAVMHFFKSNTTNGMNLTDGGILDIRSAEMSPAPMLMMAKALKATPTVAPFNTLTMSTFDGDGTGMVKMSTDGTNADKLVITDSATGNAFLDFTPIGSNPTSEKIEVVNLDEAANKNVSFKLSDGTVDVGAWMYNLDKGGNGDDNWYLLKTAEPSNDAQIVAGIPALHLSVVKSGMNELRKRLGDLRNNNDNEKLSGLWVRTYGKNLHINDKANTDMNLYGFEGGFDGMVNALGGKIYAGIMAGTLESHDIRVTTSQGKKAKGWTRSPSAGAYLTWMQNTKNGNWFTDFTARHFWVNTNIDRNDGSNGYDVKRNFWGLSAEIGRLFYVESPEFMNIGVNTNSQITIEPKFELRYKRGNSEHFKLENGVQGYVDTTESFATKLNLQMNYLPEGDKSKWKPFVEFGVYNEWDGATNMKFSGSKINTSETEGFGFEASVGANATISDDTYAFGAFTLETGKVYTSYQLNLGIRVKF